MTIPTRRIEEPEFNELQKLEGDTIQLHKLTALSFEPPVPHGQARVVHKRAAMNILLMNVSDPVIYKDPETKMTFIIMNGYDQDNVFTYENFQDCHITKGAWCYRLAPSYWDEENDDLDIAFYTFNHFDREEQGLDEV